MNQILRAAFRGAGHPIASPAPAVTIDYDDGVPGTVVPQLRRRSLPSRDVRRGADGAPRSTLATIARDAAVDYDDGNPATILS
jgi:hypothetical protein